jgi:hypothetical protein
MLKTLNFTRKLNKNKKKAIWLKTSHFREGKGNAKHESKSKKMTKKAIESQPQVNGGVGTQSFVYFRSEN